MNGFVKNRQAVVSIVVVGPITGTEETFDVVVDTGFDDDLTLPVEAIARLALPAEGDYSVMLADGSVVKSHHFTAEVIWHDGVRRSITVQMASGTPLLGMGLMAGSKLTMHIHESGAVSLEPEP